MIPYNPSSFNTNKTILEQILELKNWLKDHPSYRVFMSTANGNDSMPDTYNLSDILDDADQLNVGDVVLFSNGCVGSVSSLDVDNQTFDCNLPCVSIKGPQGPRGYTGKGISNAQVDASGDLEITIFDPSTSTSTTTNVGHVKGADGTNGTNGTDGAYVSSASVDASGDLQITIYDPATSTSSVVNAGHVVGADGQGIQIIDVTTTTGVLSASDLAKVTGTDDCTINYTSVNGTISFKRLFWDSAYAYFTGVYVDTDTYYCVTEIELATGAFSIDINPLPIKDSNIDSGSATNGQVLTANGSGGASWEDASGGIEIIDITARSTPLTSSEMNKIKNHTAVLVNNNIYYTSYWATSTNIYLMAFYSQGSILSTYRIIVTISTGSFTIYTVENMRYNPRASDIDSQTATNGQVLTANGSGGASWSLVSESGISSGSISNSKAILHSNGSGGATFSRMDAGDLTCGTATNGQVLTASNGNAVWQTPNGRYIHNISLFNSTDSVHITLQIINTTNTAYTSLNDVKSALTTLGFDGNNGIVCSGASYTNNTLNVFCKLSPAVLNFLVEGYPNSLNISYGNSSYSVYDKVVTL